MHARSECSTGWKFCRPIQPNFRGAGCVFSPSPLLLSLSPPFLPPSFLPSVRVCPLPPSFSAPPPLASWRPHPISFIPWILSFNNGNSKLTYLSRWSETQCLTTASAPPKVFKSVDTGFACSWCSVKVRTNSYISTHTAQNYQAPFCYKN